MSSARPSKKPAKPTRNADEYLATLQELIGPIANAFGERCEIVLHDFRQPERSIVCIAGNVTGRSAGGSVTQIGLSIIKAGDAAEPHYDYITRTPGGRILKSITVPLRDHQDHVFGAVCVNIDVTEMWLMVQSLQDAIGGEAPSAPPRPIAFVDNIDRVISDVVQEETKMLGRPLDGLSKSERAGLIRALDRRGVFSLQRAVPQVADYLGLTRATVYNDLKELRNGGNGVAAPNGHVHPETSSLPASSGRRNGR